MNDWWATREQEHLEGLEQWWLDEADREADRYELDYVAGQIPGRE